MIQTELLMGFNPAKRVRKKLVNSHFGNMHGADGKDEWLTPPEIITSLGSFDLDPCSPIARPWPTAKTHFTIQDDGLSQKWDGRVWMNPPYGENTFVWMRRLADH